MTATESQLEKDLVSKLADLKYSVGDDIRDRAHLTDSEFQRLRDGNIRDCCKNDFEAVNQVRMNTDHSPHRDDAMLLINGVPVVHIELKTLAVSPRRAMQRIVHYRTALARATSSPRARIRPSLAQVRPGPRSSRPYSPSTMPPPMAAHSMRFRRQAAATTSSTTANCLPTFRSGRPSKTRTKEQQDRDQSSPGVPPLDFAFMLFTSGAIDYDYLMGPIAKLTQQKPGKLTLNREQLIGLIQSDARFIDEGEDIAEYLRGLPVRRIFDGERLSVLRVPLELGWKARPPKARALLGELTPVPHELAQGQAIAGLAADEEGR